VPARDAYSKVIGLLKIVLPLAALGLLSTVFLVSRSIDPDQAVAMAPVDIDALVREPRISQARFAGVTDEGAALTVLAESARADPDRGLNVTLSLLTGTLETAQGQPASFRADEGRLDEAAGTLLMHGDVHLRSEQGYDLRMDALRARLDRTHVHGWGDVHGDGPAGTVRAEGVVLRPSESDERSTLLVFTGNVRLVYTPPDRREQP